MVEEYIGTAFGMGTGILMILWGLGVLGSGLRQVKSGHANNIEPSPRKSDLSLLEKARGYTETTTTAETATPKRTPRTPYQVVIVCIGIGVCFLFLAGLPIQITEYGTYACTKHSVYLGLPFSVLVIIGTTSLNFFCCHLVAKHQLTAKHKFVGWGLLGMFTSWCLMSGSAPFLYCQEMSLIPLFLSSILFSAYMVCYDYGWEKWWLILLIFLLGGGIAGQIGMLSARYLALKYGNAKKGQRESGPERGKTNLGAN